MGLAGRKTRQRIAADPRNLTWSDDSSKFGAKYLQSLGWTHGMGLGVSGEGRTSNLKIHQKLDLMGIGANRRGADDAGWKGGREFEGLLARLNQTQEVDSRDIPLDCENVARNDNSHLTESTKAKDSKDLARSSDHIGGAGADTQEDMAKALGEAREKKKRKKPAIQDEAKEAKRRKKEGAGEKRTTDEATQMLKGNHIGEQVAAPPEKTVPRYRAHRARHIASKRLAATSTTSINEILGIASSTVTGLASGTTSRSSATPSKQTVADDVDQDGPSYFGLKDLLEQATETDEPGATQGPGTGLESSFAFGKGLGFRGGVSKMADSEMAKEKDTNNLLRTTGKSVAEYFEEKMRMKNGANDAPVEGEEPQRKKKKKKSSS